MSYLIDLLAAIPSVIYGLWGIAVLGPHSVGMLRWLVYDRYIDGRELYVGVLGNQRLMVLPIWELLFTKVPEEAPRIATERVKWDAAYRTRHGIKSNLAKGLPDALVARIKTLCKRIYRVLELSGYARIVLSTLR